MKQLREEFFSPEIITKLEMTERNRKEKDLRESNYYTKETELLNSTELDEEEKAERLIELQDEIFGEGADNFRERLSLRVN